MEHGIRTMGDRELSELYLRIAFTHPATAEAVWQELMRRGGWAELAA